MTCYSCPGYLCIFEVF